MKLPAGINQWGSAVLGVVSFILVAKLVAQYRAMQPGHSQTHPATASVSSKRTAKGPSHVADDLAQYDPEIHFDALKALDSRPLPDEDRNPFEFAGGPPPAPPKPAEPPKPAPAPPPPPPLPLKAMGYNELPGGKKEAIVSLNDDVEMVHEGEMIGTRFKVLKIDPAKVVVEDGEDKKTVELPFPQ
jgi:hypothetical protein